MEAAGDPVALGTELTGDLCCARCRYNLRGLSVRGVCPECGTPVAVTLLRVVDPQAAELQPMIRPRLTAIGLAVWSGGALGGAVLGWVVRGAEAAGRFHPGPWVSAAMTVCIAAAAIGGLVMVFPHRGIRRAHMAAAAGSAVAGLALAWLNWWILREIDGVGGRPYLSSGVEWSVRWLWKVLETVVLGLAVLGAQPVFRTLQSRSYLLRTGRLERQTLKALVASVGVMLAGDVLQVGARVLLQPSFADIPALVAMCLTGVGSLLFTAGLVGVAIDVKRLLPVVVSPPLGLTDVLAAAPAAGGPGAGPDRAGARVGGTLS